MQTKISPKIYLSQNNEYFSYINYNHGILFPILELVLSDKYPTKGVAIPSEICPDNKTSLFQT